MAIMVPKGLAAAVLATIPFQQGVIGGELIKSVTYGVVLLSIIMTSILLLLLEKTPLMSLYAWIFALNGEKLADYYDRIISMPKPQLSGCRRQLSSLDMSKLPGKIRKLSAETRTQVKTLFYDIGRPKEK